MRTTPILLAFALVATTLALIPAASASPPTCDGLPTDHALVAYVDCAVTCVENLKNTGIVYYPGSGQIVIYPQPCPI